MRQSTVTPGRPNVLLIEDDPGVAEVIVRALAEREIGVTASDRGIPGLDLAASGEFDLVLLDLLLPDIDGVSLLERLLAVSPNQQVLVVSALSNVEAKVRCLDIGAADYLAKPFALEELAARVHARVRMSRLGSPAGERYLRDGGLTLDLQRRLALVSGRPVPLSSREFSLLEFLMRHEGQVCTRTELLETIWGYTFDPGSNVVDVYVSRLRQKLPQLQIETVRNVGYCLLAT